MSAPLLPDVGVLGLVPGWWGGLWMGRHYLLTGLARYFQVVWVNPATEWRDWLPWRHQARVLVPASPTPIPGFSVFEPGPLRPRFYRPAWLGRATARAALRAARARLVRAGASRIVVSLWRPGLASALDLVPHDLSCYHVADEYRFSRDDLPTPPEEAALLQRVDQVIVHSEGLLEKKGRYNPRTILLPNGVDYTAFATPAPEPEAMRAIPRPRVGYVGVVKEQLDLPLLLRLARAHPEWHFVFIGPIRERPDVRQAVAALSALPNTHFLGPYPAAQLPAYVQALDVGIMCYAADGYTPYVSPLKLHEYLAAALPVVATPIRTMMAFRDVARLARDDADWSAAIAESVGPQARTPAAAERRRAVARGYDWAALTARLAALLCDRLGPAYRARLEDARTPLR